MTRRLRQSIHAGVILGVVLCFTASARADDPIKGRYATGDRVRAVYFDASVPSKWRKAISRAAATWNKLPATDWVVHTSPSVAVGVDPCAPHGGSPIGGVLRGVVAGGLLAENRSCIDTRTGQLIGFRQTYNSQIKFYPGTGKVPAKKFDLQSVATHELGHSEGWFGDHYSGRNDSGLCANKPKQATLCPVIFPGHDWLRSLTKHDKHPVVTSYAQPPISQAAVWGEPWFPEDNHAAAAATAPGGAGARGCLIRFVRAVKLGAGADLSFSQGGDDCIVGGFGADDLRPAAGDDTVIAGPGSDIIVGGPGSDLILAGLGTDQIYAADGEFDRVRCGRDLMPDQVLTADPLDSLTNCERPPASFAAIPLPPAYG